jgi:hypothetical protein
MANTSNLFSMNMFPQTDGTHIPGGMGAVNNAPVLQEAPWTSIPLAGRGTGTNTGSNNGITVTPYSSSSGTSSSGFPGVPGASSFPGNTAGGVPMDTSALFGASGFAHDKDLPNKLNKLFGGGMGATILQMLQTGGFNPAVAQAFINAMIPQEQRGIQNIANEFSNSGLRNSSAAAVGMGDFESQFNSQIMSMLGQMENQSTDRQFSLLSQIMNPAHAEKANEASIFDMISGGLGMASGVISSGALGGLGIYDPGDLFSKIPIPGMGNSP